MSENLIPMVCQKCGGEIELEPSPDGVIRFRCTSCGTRYVLPGRAPSRRRLDAAKAYFSAGDFASAHDSLTQATNESNSPEAWFWLALLALLRGDLKNVPGYWANAQEVHGRCTTLLSDVLRRSTESVFSAIRAMLDRWQSLDLAFIPLLEVVSGALKNVGNQQLTTFSFATIALVTLFARERRPEDAAAYVQRFIDALATPDERDDIGSQPTKAVLNGITEFAAEGDDSFLPTWDNNLQQIEEAPEIWGADASTKIRVRWLESAARRLAKEEHTAEALAYLEKARKYGDDECAQLDRQLSLSGSSAVRHQLILKLAERCPGRGSSDENRLLERVLDAAVATVIRGDMAAARELLGAAEALSPEESRTGELHQQLVSFLTLSIEPETAPRITRWIEELLDEAVMRARNSTNRGALKITKLRLSGEPSPFGEAGPEIRRLYVEVATRLARFDAESALEWLDKGIQVGRERLYLKTADGFRSVIELVRKLRSAGEESAATQALLRLKAFEFSRDDIKRHAEKEFIKLPWHYNV